MSDIVEYINWFNSPNWQASVILGKAGRRYDFTANWNVRDSSWYITISFENQNIIAEIPLRLNVNLLQYANSQIKPTCALVPICEDTNIERITFEHMTSGVVKLYHILPENIE
jgi:hypothetical protein